MSVLLFLAGFALLSDFIGDSFVNARDLDRMDAAREHVEDKELHRHSHNNHSDSMEKHLHGGEAYHFGNDGEIIFDKPPHHQKADHEK